MAKAEKVVLVDGSWLVFRAYFAIPPSFTTSAGLRTNATYGFATMFRKLFAGRRPDRGAVVFDAPGPVHREATFPGYKADRPPMPDELGQQLPWIHRVVAANGFRAVSCPGWEADDVVGTLTRAAVEAGHEVLIVAGDKDFAQLIGERVRMYDPVRDVTYDAALAQKRWGVRPDQVVDLLALMGDAVDNIPGVAGIGEKTAKSLLEQHGSLEGVYDALSTLPTRARTALEAGREAARLSQALATIDQRAPIEVGLDDLVVPEPDVAALDAVYRELEFRSLLSRAAEAAPLAAAPVLDGAGAVAFFAGAARVALAPVLDAPVAGGGTLVGLGLATAEGAAAYVPAGEIGALAAVLGDSGVPKVAHDHKALAKALHRRGVSLAGCEDTMLASFLVEPTKCVPHRLDQVSREYLQRPVPDRKALTGAGQAERRAADLDPEACAAWAGEQARAVAALWPVLVSRLDEAGLFDHYVDVELPLAAVLGRMEEAGILVDRDDLARLGEEFRARKAGLEVEVHALAGHPFNLGSTQQLAAVLFEELKLPVTKRNKTGYSTDSETLEAIDHPIARLVLEHRGLAKLIHTYTDVLAASVDATSGRVHATFQQTTGVSGRLISTDPDLQRTPVRTPEGRRIRHAFVAPPGTRLLSADWSQIELRVLAHFSGDERLVEAFRENRDVHRATAAELFHVAPAEVTAEQRNVGKTINFATLYGQGATALAQILRIPRKDAQAHIDRFFATYAGVRRWLDTTIAEASATGAVTTLLGRRRFIPELSSHAPMDRQAGERIAANTPIQGSAADLCKLAMLKIDEGLRPMRARMLLQVHDELVFEVPEDEVDAVRALVTEAMTHPLAPPDTLRVPLVVNVGVGGSWAEAH